MTSDFTPQLIAVHDVELHGLALLIRHPVAEIEQQRARLIVGFVASAS
jgi:hypothetical protein